MVILALGLKVISAAVFKVFFGVSFRDLHATGLRVHLALTTAGNADADSADAAVKTATDEERNPHMEAQKILWEPAQHHVGAKSCATASPQPALSADIGTHHEQPGFGPEPGESRADESQKEPDSARAQGRSSQEGSEPSLNHELSSQLAGLRRRAKIRQYTA